ncbi:MAG: hypothetical protein VKO44_06865 [Cyanobacteriota bacterium]|nr:hypothetical protein [Cyanobacteriota bacterium]
MSLDARGDADQIRFVQALATQLLWADPRQADGADADGSGRTWEAFCRHRELSPEAMAAFAAAEAREAASHWSDHQLVWLSRPHFVLLLVVIRLLRHQRQLLNALPARHLRHLYQARLGFSVRPGAPDRLTVAFRLAPDASPLVLKEGTVLRAGVDEQGQERLYRTLSELSLNHAHPRRLRGLRLEQGLTTLATFLEEEPQPLMRLERMFRLAYGVNPDPASELPPQSPARVANLRKGPIPALLSCFALDGTASHPQLEMREFLQLMRLVRQRSDAGSDQEWATINGWLGLDNPSNPRDFFRNFCVSVFGETEGDHDWKADGLSQVNSIDDLYLRRGDSDVRDYLTDLFGASTCRLKGADDAAKFETFERLMTIKLHIDAQWQQVNWLLERCGRRRRQRPSWRLDPSTPNSVSPAFGANLAKALDVPDANAFPWPLPLRAAGSLDGLSPQGAAAIPPRCWQAFQDLEALEERYALPLEELNILCAAIAAAINPPGNPNSWATIQEVLSRVHAERWAADRRAALARCREGLEPEAAFIATLRRALGSVPRSDIGDAPPSLDSLDTKALLERLNPWLPPGALEALQRFAELLKAPGTAPRRLSWAEVDALLERAQRVAGREAPPPLQTLNWRQLHRVEQLIDAKAMAAGELLAPCLSASGGEEAPEPQPGPGFGVASPLLLLAEGHRTLELQLACLADNGSREALLDALRGPDGQGLKAEACAGEPPSGPNRAGWGLNQALLVEVSTADGWWAVPLAAASIGAVTPAKGAMPARWTLTLKVELQGGDPPLAPLEASGGAPRWRVRLRPWSAAAAREDPWRSRGAFDGLRLAAAQLRVRVEGLKGVRLQQDGSAVDLREPIHPFGVRPEVGSRLYISHPALLAGDLESISFAGRWLKRPPDLAKHYEAYTGWAGLTAGTQVAASSFQIKLSLRERGGGLLFNTTAPLFAPANNDTLDLTCQLSAPLPPCPALQLEGGGDLRDQERVWCWELTPTDFGHGLQPALMAGKAQAYAKAISDRAALQALAMTAAIGADITTLKARYDAALGAVKVETVDPAKFVVAEPYTPLLGELAVGYSRCQPLGGTDDGASQLLRVHVFGEEEPLTLPPAGSDGLEQSAPVLLPLHPHPGEVWLEMEGLRAGQPLALAFQLAEGSARGDRPAEALRWEVRRDWQWRPLPVREDGTNGLLHSGIVRFVMPQAAAAVVPAVAAADRIWIRALLLAPVEAYATILSIQSQAVEAEAMAPVAERSLPPHSVTALEEAVPAIASLHQPFSSRAGRPPETEAEMRIRAAERLRHKDRALAGWDYERLLWDGFASQLHAVVCLPAQERRGLEVVVIPNLLRQVPRNLFAPGAPTDLLAAMEQHLRERCPADAAPVVRNAAYVHVSVRLWVCLREGVDPAYAERQLEQTLIRLLSPWCFDAAAEVRLGGEVRAIDVVAAVEALPFVAHLEQLRLFLVDPGGKPLRQQERGVGDAAVLLAPAPDVVLIAAPRHTIDFVAANAPLPSQIGIGVMRVGLDFQVA